ncbi:hypothetical protein A2865_03725 [Candidatus Woesebacteria bacterium RIFCSPHIGHO2_01_FULL_39_17]|uniref:CBU-0592-like domain-containing protein n=2 Tax=Candidatus Woeseibacteriota TaxID=1752722 RepID=A0A0G0RKF5_9BACT|nr:MAG: hypothetical protein US72_C0001G0057 [Microgenomates group bacterium GW2011_GWC1_38_12]KKR14092.1 MAG: hypothetical protein UT40_C0005G0021 [Candidatus Woesebacteria bacterium GW2011_GWA1_39_21b]OGM23536.1 MAG: hypothetical protein A2865_03725 [Candidatus Woesebacteria bacterium RIFCSPHIGHO2_01_FULL_39_17]OGM62981.1 MAG: hypothetical protein A3A52_03250 [Candidatus Woesebacteria bacterium RIFCSPLOWO2_01_FULL_39_14]
MIYEVVGWIGTFAILLAYYLVSTKKLSADNRRYQILNVVGAIGIIINSGVHGVIPSVGLNTAWLLIGLYGLIKVVKK